MPGLTIATDAHPILAPPRRTGTNANANANANARRTSSPPRPPISPITPTLGPSQLPSTSASSTSTTAQSQGNNNNSSSSSSIPDFALGRPAFTHTTQPAHQVGIAPPPAQPIIDFDENPDVIALKSAISILQLQRARATADIRSLSRAKAAALADPAAFVADLDAGRVGAERDPLFPGTDGSSDDDDGDDDVNEEEEEQDGDDDGGARREPRSSSRTRPKTDGATDGDTPMTDGAGPAAPKKRRRNQDRATHNNNPAAAGDGRGGPANPAAAAAAPPPSPPWRKLPKPQNVVRCPPINWAQYGVVGESLDKLHAEQLAAPTPGAPVPLGPGGTYEFGAGAGDQAAAAGEQPRQRLVGIAAPYTPGRDKLEKKGKGGKR